MRRLAPVLEPDRHPPGLAKEPIVSDLRADCPAFRHGVLNRISRQAIRKRPHTECDAEDRVSTGMKNDVGVSVGIRTVPTNIGQALGRFNQRAGNVIVSRRLFAFDERDNRLILDGFECVIQGPAHRAPALWLRREFN